MFRQAPGNRRWEERIDTSTRCWQWFWQVMTRRKNVDHTPVVSKSCVCVCVCVCVWVKWNITQTMFIPLSTRIMAVPCPLLLPPLRPDSMKPWQEWKVWSERRRMPWPEERGQRPRWRVFWEIWGKRSSLMRISKIGLNSTQVRQN